MRSAMRSISSSPLSTSHTTTNSSPPSRATVSDGRTMADRRRATAISMSSPTSWPSTSLISLNSSRSSRNTATPDQTPAPVSPGDVGRRASSSMASCNPFGQEGPVGQTGQRIVQGQIRQALLVELLLGDVVDGHHGAQHPVLLVDQGLAVDADLAPPALVGFEDDLAIPQPLAGHGLDQRVLPRLHYRAVRPAQQD